MTPAAPTIHGTATELQAAGVNTIPTRPDHTKRPAIPWKTHTTRPTTQAEIDAWFSSGDHGYGLGIITGTTSGRLIMIEAEGRATHHIPTLAQLAEDTGLGDLWARVTTGWRELSPSGGIHWFIRLADDGTACPGNRKIANTATREPLFETRGEGGFVVAAPTPGTHHPTGRGWTRITGGPTTIPTLTLEEYETFCTILATTDQAPTPAPAPAAPATGHTDQAGGAGDWTEGRRPGEDYETRTDWADILTPHGWTHSHTSHDGTRFWTRPGKNPRDGFSATTGHADDRDRLYVFTTSTELPSETPLTKFGAYALLEHGGDHKAAARALAGQGYGKEPHINLPISQLMPASTTTPQTSKDTPWTSTSSSSSTTPEHTKAPSHSSTETLNSPKASSTAASTHSSTATTTPTQTSTERMRPTSGPVTSASTSSSTTGTSSPTSVTETDSTTIPEGRAPLARSEYGNTAELITRYGHLIRYCYDRGRWLTWDGHTWNFEPAGGGTVREYAITIACDLPENSQEGTNWKKKSLTAPVITNVLKHAETYPGIAVAYDDLDNQPWELNTPGGIIDLRTGELHPSDPTHLHTRQTLVTPDFQATTHRWEEFLNDTFPNNPELIDYLQRLCGYSAVGQVREHILPFAYGPGGNGKSVFLDVNAKILGDYATTTPGGFLMANKFQRHGTEIARLSGARWTNCSEVNEHDQFDEAKVKLLTGGDTLSANFMRKDLFDFTPTHHLWLAGNYWPSVESGGESFWRRLRLIPFTEIVPPEKRVEDLQGILVAEHGPAILAWIARGAADYYRNGLQEPDGVKVATEEYRESQDTVARFLEERCLLTPGNGNYTATVKKFRAEYETWCYEEGEEAAKGRSLASQLKRHGVLVGREAPTVPSGADRVYGGVQLLSDREAATADHGRSDLFG